MPPSSHQTSSLTSLSSPNWTKSIPHKKINGTRYTWEENSYMNNPPKLSETKSKNDSQTRINLQQTPPQETYKMWGGHRLQDHPRNPPQNSTQHVRHTIRTRRRKLWSPWDGNKSIHIPKGHQAQFWTPDLSSTIGYSENQCSCSKITKVEPTAYGPSGPVSPNGKNILNHQAETAGVCGWKILQGSTPIVHQLHQSHTVRSHTEPVWLPWDNPTHGHWINWKKMKQEWSLLEPMVYLFEKIEEVAEFEEAANTPIPGGK